jgi:hypothetical protein
MVVNFRMKLFETLYPARTRDFLVLFLMIAALDVVLIASYTGLQLMQSFDRIAAVPPMMNITLDHSLGEFYTYLKWLFCAVTLGLIYRATAVRAYAQLAVVFFLLMLDDSLQIHEQVGTQFSERSPVTGLLGSGVGELLFWGFVGSLLLALVATGLRSTPRDHWGRLAGVILLLGVTAAFGVGADFLRVLAMLTEGETLKNLAVHAFGILEDGGEMLGASACCAYVFAMLRHPVHRSAGPAAGAARAVQSPRGSLGLR